MTPTTGGRRRSTKTSQWAWNLRLPALEIRQGNRTVYSFAVDGKKLSLFATVSRVHRDDSAVIQGYQRPEVLSHIASIRRYLESDEPMIPNALVIAFDKRVTFKPNRADGQYPGVRMGTLVVPIDPDGPHETVAGWIVDGQQRYAAIREAQIKSFPICVTAFITDSDSEQRSQFILVNATKPLPKGLIHELLPSTTGTLPVALELRRFPAMILDRLNYDDDSPLNGMIQTPTTPGGVIKDNSVLKMIENSLSDGALYEFRDPGTGSGDADSVLGVLKDFWAAVETAFPDAWKKPPRRSRLMHGVGVVSMGFVMDAIVDHRQRFPSSKDFAKELALLEDVCHWTSGIWRFGPDHQRRWNDLQNTPRDIQLLTDYLLAEYKKKIRRESRQANAAKRGRSTRTASK
jgi:DGQHR domain-containing protein